MTRLKFTMGSGSVEAFDVTLHEGVVIVPGQRYGTHKLGPAEVRKPPLIDKTVGILRDSVRM